MSDELLPEYEKICLSEYVTGDTKLLIYTNTENSEKMNEMKEKLKQCLSANPFEFIYDLVKFEMRDAEAMLEAIGNKDVYEHRKNKC